MDVARAVALSQSMVLGDGAVELFTDGVAQLEVDPISGFTRNAVDFREEIRAQVATVKPVVVIDKVAARSHD